VAISAGDGVNLFLRSDGTVAAKGTGVPASLTNIIAIAAGGQHNLALRANGTVIAWGNNSQGQLNVPPGLNHVVAIAAGDYHSTALRDDGTVVVWGKYYTGSGYMVPVVPALNNVHAIAAGSDHDLALFNRSPPSPVITVQPLSQIVLAGSNATFSVTASPAGSRLSYQWRFNQSNDIAYATNSSLVLTNVQSTNAGLYSVWVTNLFGSILSSNALLKVDHPPVADASATRSTVISTNGVNGTVVLDGSRSFDPDSDPLQYFWFSTPSTLSSIPLATGVVAVVALPVGIHPIALRVSDGFAWSTNDVTVMVLTPSQAVGQLTSLLTESGLAQPGPLMWTLWAAQASLGRGDFVAAASQLQAFIYKVKAQVAPSDPALAQMLTAAAQQVIDALLGVHATRLDVVNRQANGTIQLRFNGTPGQINIVEASTNLTDWEIIGLACEQTEGVFELEDTDAAKLPNRFYRVRSL
jgi:hypothetical protein